MLWGQSLEEGIRSRISVVPEEVPEVVPEVVPEAVPEAVPE